MTSLSRKSPSAITFKNPAMTLMELLIAIALLALISLGVYSLSTFSQGHVVNSGRQAVVQNELSLALDHMYKHISQAIGNRLIDGLNGVINTDAIGTDEAVRAFIDANTNGQRDTAAAGDRWIAYRLNGNRIQFCPQCATLACDVDADYQNVNGRACITGLGSVYDPNNNFLGVTITGCWDPAQAVNACGSTDNPAATMQIRIDLPSVSVN